MITNRLENASRAAIVCGGIVGGGLAGICSAVFRGLFSVPANGVGFVTVHQYPKSFDYFVISMLIGGAFVGAVLAGALADKQEPDQPATRRSFRSWPGAVVVFVLMLFVHDHPNLPLEPFHDGEHLTPAFLFRGGARPFRDVFVLHGLAVDGGLDALVLGDPPSLRRTRRLETLLDAATLALFVPIAAELCVTPLGAAAGVLATLAAIGAGWVPVFPYFRLLPLMIVVLALLRRAPILALVISAVSILWSLDTGLYAFATAVIFCLLMRPMSWRRTIMSIAGSIAAPLLLLVLLRGDIHLFLVDSFVTIPRSIDAIWSLPMRSDLSWESARYFLPPVFFAILLVLAIRADSDDRWKLVVIAIASILAFRSSAGRCSWSHTRYGVPFVGLAFVAFVVEPLFIARKWILASVAAAVLTYYAEVVPNALTAGKFLIGWHARQSHQGLVAYPVRTGKGIYTSAENAADLAALNDFLPRDVPILDVSNERALLYLLERKPATRCVDIAMLSAPPLFAEAMKQLEKNPPAVVIVSGSKDVDQFDGLPNRQRVPALFSWIDSNYPKRSVVGRFVIATR